MGERVWESVCGCVAQFFFIESFHIPTTEQLSSNFIQFSHSHWQFEALLRNPVSISSAFSMRVRVQACVCPCVSEWVCSDAAEICEECNLASGCLTQPECSLRRRARTTLFTLVGHSNTDTPLNAHSTPTLTDSSSSSSCRHRQRPNNSRRLTHWALGQHIVAPRPSLGKQLELHFKIARLMLMDLLGHEYLSRVQD